MSKEPVKHEPCLDCDALIDWHRQNMEHCACGSLSWPCSKAKIPFLVSRKDVLLGGNPKWGHTVSKEPRTCEYCEAVWFEGRQEHSLRECRDNLASKLNVLRANLQLLLIKSKFGANKAEDAPNPRANLPVGQRRAGVPRRKSNGRRR